VTSISAFPPLPDPQSCVVGEEWRDRTVIITVSGELDIVTVPHLDVVVKAALKKRPSAVIIDLMDVGFLGSCGMSALVRAREDTPDDVPVLTVALGPATSRPLRLVGIDKVVPLFVSVAEAVEAATRASSDGLEATG
jgi:anti-sigma B factor antagonist